MENLGTEFKMGSFIDFLGDRANGRLMSYQYPAMYESGSTDAKEERTTVSLQETARRDLESILTKMNCDQKTVKDSIIKLIRSCEAISDKSLVLINLEGTTKEFMTIEYKRFGSPSKAIDFTQISISYTSDIKNEGLKEVLNVSYLKGFSANPSEKVISITNIYTFEPGNWQSMIYDTVSKRDKN